MSDPAVAVRGLAKVYAPRFGTPVEALKPLTLEIPPGTLFGLLGPNGAGKTTLVKLLLGIVHPSQGEGALFGRSIRDPEARRAVGFLPENHRFPPFLTARQALDLYGRTAGVASGDRAKRAEALLERVRLTPAADRPIRTFSKGMMQRLGLAQAMLSRPRLLFLDEPTDGVDPVGRREIRDLLLELAAEGTTLFLNSHLLSEVEQICTRVAILKHGALVREGSVEELTTPDRLYEITCTAGPQALPPAVDAATIARDLPAADGLVRFSVAAPDRAALNALLDALRASGTELEAVTPVRQSLEDTFVDVVTGDAPEAQA